MPNSAQASCSRNAYSESAHLTHSTSISDDRGVPVRLQEASIFLFEKRLAEKLHKPKRKDTVCEVLRGSVRQLERFRHPKILQVS